MKNTETGAHNTETGADYTEATSHYTETSAHNTKSSAHAHKRCQTLDLPKKIFTQRRLLWRWGWTG